MKKTATQIATIAVVLAVFTFGGFVAGRRDTQPTAPTLADTVIIRDTIREEIPVVKYSLTTRVDTVWLPITEPLNSGSNPDSTQVVVPIERKTYQTADYKAVIEGFHPSLVSMEVYRQTQFIDRLQTVKVPDVRRWSFGPAIGYGVTVQNGRIVGVPTVGVSVQYAIIKW